MPDYEVYGTGDDYGMGMPDLVRAKNKKAVRKKILKGTNVFQITRIRK